MSLEGDELKTIFVVDDEMKIRELIKVYLENEGFVVKAFDNGTDAFRNFQIEEPDMLVLDIMMPVLNGFELCKEIRKTSQVPIIIVSAKDEELDRILGLELGSDDYLSKPFSPRELVVRIKNMFRRMDAQVKVSVEKGAVLGYDNTVIDIEARSVTVSDKELMLTMKEFELLNMMMKYKGQALSRDQILDVVWGYEYIGETRLVDDVIKRIRRKLNTAGSSVEIQTVWGYGYKIG